MLTVFRSNRAEWLAELLAAQLRTTPPGPLDTVQVVVNTWPTSRWLGEQLAEHLGGITANIRFPFPGSQLRRLVNAVLADAPADRDPWRASELVWPVLELLPQLVEQPAGRSLRHWLEQRRSLASGSAEQLDLGRWQLGRAIADALDDYALYRPDLLADWWRGELAPDGEDAWQPLLVQLLRQRLQVQPFGLKVLTVIEQLERDPAAAQRLLQLLPGGSLRLFGLSSMAPLQVRLLQAIGRHAAVDLYLLTPGPDLWQRCGSRRAALSDAVALQQPIEGDWLLQAPGLEARFGRLGGEFQQLLEGSGEVELGQWQERDLFNDPTAGEPDAVLLHQLQRQLARGDSAAPDRPLQRQPGDSSLEFHPCPGRLRQVQIVRDRILQLLADDDSLEPRDVLVMTPQVDAFAPLVASVFGDREATGVALDWRLTDRSQQSEAGIGRSLLDLLQLAGERLTASGLEALLESSALHQRFQLTGDEMAALHRCLQQLGFRWGLDGRERGGDATGSLAWACDRLLLGLVLPELPGLAPGGAAPQASGHSLELVGRWLHLLGRLRHWLGQLRRPRSCAAWADTLRQLLSDLFGEGGERDWELPAVLATIDDWQRAAAGCELELAAAVVAAVLDERLAADSGRFGHRSGALTISALEPMRAIPHRVVVLMGLDAGVFPRQRQRPGFHRMERQRLLGDPNPADQDRYVLLEALLSARDHLLITWSSRDERRGEALPPATPVRQWIDWLSQQLPAAERQGLVASHPANPLERRNFLPADGRPAPCCDQRLLEARRRLEQPQRLQPPLPLAISARTAATDAAATTETTEAAEIPALDPYRDLRNWLVAPQEHWLQELGLQPKEWADLLDDLDALSLGEQQRSRLLRQQLQAAGTSAAGDAPGSSAASWLQQERGRASLPPRAAGQLEADLLAQRWQQLHSCLEELGPEQQRQPAWQQWRHSVLWRGDTLLQLHTAKSRWPERLELWLQLLLCCAAGEPPQQAVLVARGKQGFAVQLRLTPPPMEEATAELERLLVLRHHWAGRCWPVPPRTGWAWLRQGERQAAEIWQGSSTQRGERQDPVQGLCFGSELPAAALLQPALEQHLLELLQPLQPRIAMEGR